jgi:hypothetical protein
MLPRLTREQLEEHGATPELGHALRSRLDALEAAGFPVLDAIRFASEEGDPLDVYRRAFDALPVGVTHLLLHPSVAGHDIEAITRSAPQRIADYRTFLRPELREHIVERGIHLIGYRHLRDLIGAE